MHRCIYVIFNIKVFVICVYDLTYNLGKACAHDGLFKVFITTNLHSCLFLSNLVASTN